MNKIDFKFFNSLLLIWLTLSWVGFLLTLFGLFYWWLFIVITLVILYFVYKYRRFTRPSQQFIITSALVFIISLFFSFSTNPTIFSGRDQGSISQASIRLAQNHKLQFSTSASETFWQINKSASQEKFNNCLKNGQFIDFCQAISSSKALNFPGFYYTSDGNLITQFPLAYISYLAIFFTFFGLNGLLLANAILLFLFTMSFYLLLKRLLPTDNSHLQINLPSISIVLLLSSFCFMWFAKFTLTENMASALLWIGIFQLMILLTNKTRGISLENLVIVFLSFGLLIFTRIEGFVFFTLALIVLFFAKNTKNYFRTSFLKVILPTLLFLAIIFVLNFKINSPFYKAIFTASQSNFSDNSSTIGFNDILNLFKVFILYGLFFPIIFGTIGIFKICKSSIQKKRFLLLTPLFIVLPVLFYLYDPQITPDHPWMLRRFTFAILPLFLFYSMLLMQNLITNGYKKIVAIILSLILLANIYPTINYLFFSPNKNLFKQTTKISEKFSNNDLILIDRSTTGNHWAMIADPLNSLFHKNAVYFFNPSDLAKLSLTQYDKIYLITPESRVDFYRNSVIAERLLLSNYYKFETNNLDTLSLNNFFLPPVTTRKTKGIIFEIKK